MNYKRYCMVISILITNFDQSQNITRSEVHPQPSDNLILAQPQNQINQSQYYYYNNYRQLPIQLINLNIIILVITLSHQIKLISLNIIIIKITIATKSN